MIGEDDINSLLHFLTVSSIAIVGGPGTGKTTLAKLLTGQADDVQYVRMARHSVLVPYTLYHNTHPQLFSFDRDEYIQIVADHVDIELPSFNSIEREELDTFGRRIFDTFGDTVTSEITFLLYGDAKNVFDNVAKEKNVAYMRERDVHTVGLTCDVTTKVKRRLNQRKPIEPTSAPGLQEQIRSTEELLEKNACLERADVVYDTEELPEDYAPILPELLDMLKFR